MIQLYNQQKLEKVNEKGMIKIKKVKIFAHSALLNKEIYLIIRTAEKVFISKVEKIRSSMVQWNLEGSSIVLQKEQCLHSTVVELWEYNQLVLIGKHSVLKLGSGDKNQCSYNGFIGSGQQEIRLNIAYEMEVGEKEVKPKAKQTKRTDSTNRQSNNSLTHVIEQPSSIKQLYKSLIHSISQRNIGNFNPKMGLLENKSAQLIFPSKLSSKNKQFI